MGTVFEAYEEKMGRRVALKVLARHLSESEKAGDRFAREAWIAGRLSHPSLVRVFERGEDRDVSFFSMEYVDGGSLFDVIKNLRAWGKDERYGLVLGTREYVAWAVDHVAQAARGLEFAHRQGVVHRDIKPMNILLNRDPLAVKVADFGLAVDLGATRMTTAGKVMGTVAYMAPEQIRGEQDRVGPWTDVYALGVTLFEMLTLELPFMGETQQVYMNAVLTAAARRPRKLNERVGRDMEVVLQKALEKDPRDRYQDAGAFAEDLENVLHFRPIRARPPGRANRVVKWARRRPMHATLAGLLIVAVPATTLLSARVLQHRRLESRLRVEGWRVESDRLIHDEHFREALVPLDRILEERPDDLAARRTRSLSYARLAMDEIDPRSRESLQKEALDDIALVIDRLPGARWPFRVRAFLLKSFGRESEAGPDEATAARLAAPEPDFLEVQIDGILAFLANDYSKAIEAYDEMIRRRSDSADARLWRASAYEKQGKTQKAMTDYEVAAALKPSDLVSRLNLARLKTTTGALDEGDALYRKALELDPASAYGHEGLAANLLERGKGKASAGDREAAGLLFREAEQEARWAISLDPDLAWARLNLGASLMEQNRLREAPDATLVAAAIAEYDAVERLASTAGSSSDPRAAMTALVNKCDAMIQTKSLGRALRACRRVVDLNAEDATAYYNLAAAQALSGNGDEALQSLEKDFALGDRDWKYLSSDPWFESLRADSRFKKLLDRMKKAHPEG